MTLDDFFTLSLELQQQQTRVLDAMSRRLVQLQTQVQILTEVLTAILEAAEEVPDDH